MEFITKFHTGNVIKLSVTHAQLICVLKQFLVLDPPRLFFFISGQHPSHQLALLHKRCPCEH